jgi:glycosyltransferase involved in cell wall biosynthesis
MCDLTIAILAYYGGGLLTEAIASVLAQTYGDFKVIVYDDCSPHDLKSEVESFSDPRLRYVRHEKNLGVWGNTNRAMDLCDTEYLQIFHGDDIMFPWTIEELVSIMNENPQVGIAATSYWFLEGEYPHPAIKPKSDGILYGARELIEARCKGGFLQGPLISSTTIRRSVLESGDLRYRGGMLADFHFFYEANHKAVNIYISKIPLVAYRKHQSSAGAGSRGDNAILRIVQFKESQDFLLSLSSEYVFSDVVKEQCASVVIVNAIIGGSNGETLSAMRKKMEEAGITVSDDEFLESATTGAVARFVRPVGVGKMGFEDYCKERKACTDRGVPISVKKEFQYFRMYILPRRITKAMKFASIGD